MQKCSYRESFSNSCFSLSRGPRGERKGKGMRYEAVSEYNTANSPPPHISLVRRPPLLRKERYIYIPSSLLFPPFDKGGAFLQHRSLCAATIICSLTKNSLRHHPREFFFSFTPPYFLQQVLQVRHFHTTAERIAPTNGATMKSHSWLKA